MHHHTSDQGLLGAPGEAEDQKQTGVSSGSQHPSCFCPLRTAGPPISLDLAHLVGAELPLGMQVPTPGQAPAGMDPLQERVQGVTLLQDSAIPVQWASAGQQDQDCLHGVLQQQNHLCRETEAQRGEANHRAGHLSISQIPISSPEQATHLPPCTNLLTQQHKEDPKTDPRSTKDIMGALMRAQGYQDVSVPYPKHPGLALSPVTVTVLQATLPPAGTSPGG